jgi:trehalose 6-phosphate phosphatase
MRDAIAALTAAPARTALVMDFDGTLSDIVVRPDDAVPRPEVVPLLRDLSARFRTVGIVSGRPVEFLHDHLPVQGLALVGQYGLERAAEWGTVVDPRAEPFVAAVHEAADRAGTELPGVLVERKGRIAVTLHWRTDEELGEVVRAWADRAAAAYGLALSPTRMAVELRPPLGVDKGDGLAALAEGADTAMFAGDDHGDLAAFDRLTELVRAGRLERAVRVAVRSREEPAALVARADVTVDGPAGFAGFLAALVADAPA